MRFKTSQVVCAAALASSLALVGCASNEPYAPPEPSPQVSSPAIANDGVLCVGVDSTAAPLAGQNSAGELVGFDVDLAAALADELGLKVEITDVGANAETALENGSVDIVLGIEQDSASADAWESDPYLQTGIALFAADENAQVPTAESAPKIAVQTSSTSSWVAEKEFGSSALVRQNSLADAFAALGSGTATYAASDAVRGTYVLSGDDAGAQASIVALMQPVSGYCAVVSKSNSELQQAVSDALAALEEGGMIAVLEKKWLGVEWDLSSVPLTAGATSQPAQQPTESEATGETVTESGGNAVAPEDIASS